MKIIIDARLYGLENAGLGRYINNLVENLAALDKDNEYVIFLRKKYYDSLELPNNWKKVLADFRHYSFREQILLPILINKEKPDLVHFPHFNVPIFYNGPYVSTIHDLLMHQQKGMEATTLSALNYFVKRLGYRFVFNIAIKKSKFILVPSEAVKKELVKNYSSSEEKIIVTYEGVDKKIQVNGILNIQKPYFIYAGNAYPHKNLKRLVQAMVFLNTNYKRTVNLAIVSARNNFTDRLEKLIHSLGAEKYVKLLGFVSDSDLGSLMVNSVGFVFPSLSEGFGLPGLEAMKAGTLLLSSDISVFKEVYMNHALYFNHLDFSSIERTMVTALDMPQDVRLKAISEGKEFVKRYSWSKMAKETLEVYKASIGK